MDEQVNDLRDLVGELQFSTVACSFAKVRSWSKTCVENRISRAEKISVDVVELHGRITNGNAHQIWRQQASEWDWRSGFLLFEKRYSGLRLGRWRLFWVGHPGPMWLGAVYHDVSGKPLNKKCGASDICNYTY